jgi:hypothetical protein
VACGPAIPLCLQGCARFRGVESGVGFVCEAFGDQSIPIDIIVSAVDHRKPVDGDHGLTFKSIVGALDAWDGSAWDEVSVLERFYGDEFVESEHPRVGKGSAEGGEFTSSAGASGKISSTHLISSHEKRQEFVNNIVQQYLPELHIRMKSVKDFNNITLAMASNDSVTINEDVWNEDTFTKYEKEWNGLVVDPTPAGTLTHEVGHAVFLHIRNAIGFRKGENIAEKYFKAEGEFPPSPYGGENSHEWAAEAFGALVAGHTVELGSREQQEKSLAHVMRFWDEMFSEFSKKRKRTK